MRIAEAPQNEGTLDVLLRTLYWNSSQYLDQFPSGGHKQNDACAPLFKVPGGRCGCQCRHRRLSRHQSRQWLGELLWKWRQIAHRDALLKILIKKTISRVLKSVPRYSYPLITVPKFHVWLDLVPSLWRARYPPHFPCSCLDTSAASGDVYSEYAWSWGCYFVGTRDLVSVYCRPNPPLNLPLNRAFTVDLFSGDLCSPMAAMTSSISISVLFTYFVSFQSSAHLFLHCIAIPKKREGQ